MNKFLPACLLLLVEEYLTRHLSHPDSYNDLGYGALVKVDDTFEGNTKTTDTRYGLMGYYIDHSYKTKGLSGEVITREQRFILNRDGSVHVVRDRNGH
jgi:hypothetical protein